jgi:hypothetical protein
MWGPHGVDRFANVDNRKTKRFNSLYWNPGTSTALISLQVELLEASDGSYGLCLTKSKFSINPAAAELLASVYKL